MNKTVLKLSIVAMGMLLLSACSDSGDSNDSAGSGNNDTVHLLAPQSGTQSELFYGNSLHDGLGGLSSVTVIDPSNPSTVIASKDTIDTRYPVMTTALTYGENNSYSDLHVKTLSYISGADPYKVSMLKGASSEMANSSDTNLTGTGRRDGFDYQNVSYLGANQYIKVKNQAGDELLITPDMTSTDGAFAFDNKTLLTLSYPTYGAAADGYIVYDSNVSGTGVSQLLDCTMDMVTCTPIKDVTASYEFYGDIGGTTLSAIAVDDTLYKFDKSNNSMTSIAISIAGIDRPEVSGDSLYGIFDGNISRININSGVATQISTNGLADRFRAFTDDMVIYGGDDEMHAVAKDGSNKDAPIEISVTTKTRGQKYPFDLGIGKQYLYTLYSVDTQSGKTTYYACKLEDGKKECREDSYWASVTAAKNGTLNYSSSYAYTPYAYIRVDAADNYGGGKVKAIDPAYSLEGGLTMGEIATYNFQTFVNSKLDNDIIDSNGNLILYAKNDLNFKGNAFLVNLTKENSLVNLTNEPEPDISVINDGRGHCHGRKCTVCHSFAGGKIYDVGTNSKGEQVYVSAENHNIRFEFEDGSESILAKIRKGEGENFNTPLENLVGKNFTAVIVDENETPVVSSYPYGHSGAEYFNCNYCHGRDGDLKYGAPNVITVNKLPEN